MRKQRVLFVTVTVASVALGGIMMTRMTAAQGPEGRNRGRGPGGPRRDLQRPGGPGRFGGGPPGMMGTVTESDAGMGTISFNSPFGGEQSIQVTTNTKYFTQTAAKATDLKIGDQIQVQGIPNGITASSIVAGGMSPFVGGGPGGAGGPGGPGAGGQGGNAQQWMQASATATGKITSVNPLTISMGNGITISLKLAPNARVSKIVPTSFAKLKAGDRLIAMGQSSNGTFTATAVGINLEMAGMGSGGPGPVAMGGPARPGGAEGPGGAGGQAGDGSPDTQPDRGTNTNPAQAVAMMQANCRCHSGGRAPDLSHEGSRQNAGWIAEYIANPRGKNPSSRMPAMAGKLSAQQIATIADYLASQK